MGEGEQAGSNIGPHSYAAEVANASAAREPEQSQAAPVPSGPLADLPAPAPNTEPPLEGQEATESLFEEALRFTDEGRINDGFDRLSEVSGDQRDALKKAALHAYLPDIDDEQRNTFQKVKKLIGENETLTPEQEDAVVAKLTEAGMKQEDINGFLETTQLKNLSKSKIVKRLEQMTPEDKIKAEAQAIQERQGAGKLTQQAEQAKAQQVEALTAQLATAKENNDEETQKAIQGKLKKVNTLTNVMNPWLKKLEHWIDASPKDWGIRVGKLLYVIAAMIIISIIIEMNMISKTAKKR